MKRLRFGTYANTLLLCGSEALTQTKLLNTIARSVDDTCKLSRNAATLLLQCKTNLPDGRSNALGDVISCAANAEPSAVAGYFAKKVIPLLDHNKRKLSVLALREIIMEDDTIRGDTVVETVSGTTKNALQKQSKFVLSDFLAGIFLFITTLDNRIGKEAIEFLNEEYIQSFIGIQETIAFVVPRNEPDVATSAEAFNVYLTNAKEKYGSVKTLLYNDQPKPFYCFYIPNDVEHSVGRDRSNILHNITAETLSRVSNFLILDGVGGLGKSMMMRHLLLNACDNFKSFRHIPIFIPLKDYGESMSLIEFVYLKAEALNGKITDVAFTTALTDGLFLLLFDGLDEIDGERSRRFERELEAFTDKYPKNLYVISSRPYQSFVSFSRFTVLKIKPFTQQQALQLIDKLEFRPDEPAFKNKFRSLLQNSLYNTHRSFVENPLLLTIMLLTFERFADIPTKMHRFYRKAFVTLSETHDASKGGYRRSYKSGLMIDVLTDYITEFCFHSYKDGKFEFTSEEFARYFNILRINDHSTNAKGFAYDLCANLCFMYLESGKYHFTHRSFQEYFCALFFSKQKDIFLKRLGGFFEDRQKRMRGDQTFQMLYDMIPDKVETNIFIPFLQELFWECDSSDGYWAFLEKMYPIIAYENGDTNEFSINTPTSYLFGFIVRLLKPEFTVTTDDLPYDETLVVEEYGYIYENEDVRTLVNLEDIPAQYPWIQELPEVEGARLEFGVDEIRGRRGYDEILSMLDDDNFEFKSEYNAARRYLETIKLKQQNADSYFMDLL
ncbi:hypothetical protein FACS1894217_08310 [Clostridia bacterium]|nr:hypothetical protein FACS1894217_08310 [Clostridia bacterium]